MDIDTLAIYATTLKDVFTALAILVGGLWAFHKWRHSESLRKFKEIASPDGSLSISSLPLDSDRFIVSLNAIWRNCGVIPIKLDPATSYVQVYRLNSGIRNGRLDPRDGSIERLFKVEPIQEFYVMEPNTDSTMQEHFVLPSEGTYFFRWVIGYWDETNPLTDKNKAMICWRELIWNTSTPAIGNDGLMEKRRQTSAASLEQSSALRSFLDNFTFRK